jgi:hypothetical protein
MRNRIKIPILFLFLFLCLPLVPLGEFAKPFVSPEIAEQLSTFELKEAEAQTKKPPSTVGKVGIEPNFLVHSATNVTLYADSVAVNVVWDGVKRFDRILNNTAKQPWKRSWRMP